MAEKFARACKCVNHDSWTKDIDDINPLHHISKSKKVKGQVIDFLKIHGYFPQKGMLICELCCRYAKDVLMTRKSITTSLTDTAMTFIEVLEKTSEFELEKLDEKLWLKIFRLLGEKVIRKRLNEDTCNNSQMYKRGEQMENLDLQSYLLRQDKLVSSFLEGICGVSYIDKNNTVSIQSKYHFGYTLETIQSLARPKSVLPLSFLCNLIQTIISGSKMVPKVNGKISASGGYSTLLVWLKETGSNVLKCPLDDLDTYIDNIGNFSVNSFPFL